MDCDLTGCIGRSLVSCLVCRLARKSRPINRDLIGKFPVVSFYPFWDHFLNDCQESCFVPCMVIFLYAHLGRVMSKYHLAAMYRASF